MTRVLRTIFPSRLARIPYSARLFICTGAVALVYYIRGGADPAANTTMLLVWNYIAFFVILPRARECGMPFMWAIFALAPLFFPFPTIALMFRPAEYRRSDVNKEEIA